MDTHAEPALIGRDHPSAVLRAEIGRAVDSHGGLVLVTGEPGIGKTTLITGAADDARRLGALVLGSACWDSGSAPGYWPWVQVLRGLRRSATGEEWSAIEQDAGGGLAVLLGEAGARDAPDGFRLYDAVTSALVTASHRRPVVVLLDDLHWADPASLKLLEFAAGHTWFERLLLVGTYRDAEVEVADHPLRPLLSPLVAKARTVTLTGLDPGDVGRLIARTVGEVPGDDVVAEVHRRTGGNPFFVEQAARLWHSGGSVTAIAPGVRDAVRRRLSLLPEPVVGLLTTAAVLGRQFHRQVLAAVAAIPVPQADRLLDQAVAARLVAVRGGGRFAFAHDLVRETLYDALDEAEARRRHATVVTALGSSPALADRILPAEAARHAHLAGPAVPAARAVELIVAAGRAASGRMAFEEALGHFRRAASVVDDPRRRVFVLLELGGELHHADEPAEGWAVFGEAIALARRLGDPELLARVALTAYRWGGEAERADLEGGLIAEAHRALIGPGGAERSLEEQVRDLVVQLGMLARRGGDDEALGFSLSTLHDSIWGPGTAAEREALMAELAEVAHRSGDAETEQYATSLRWVALLELGDPRYYAQMLKFVAMTERGGMRRMQVGATIDQSILAAFQGRFAEAEALFEEVLNAPEQAQHTHFLPMLRHHRWSLLLQQGRFDQLAEFHATLGPGDHPYPALLEAITAVQRGDAAAASRYLAGLGERPPLPRSYLPMFVRLQAQTAAATGDAGLVARAREALLPHDGQWLVSVFGFDIGGPVTFWLGRLAAVERRWDEALARYRAAELSAESLRARPWAAEARLARAAALLDRGAPGDEDAAGPLLDAVAAEAAELGLRHVTDRVRRLRSARAEPAVTGEFRFTGTTWTVGLGGRTLHLPDAKGLRDLHFLLSHPGTDVPAVRLLDPAGGEVGVAARGLGGDAVLDDTAKAAYRRRLAALDDEIDAAAARGDDDRAARLDGERAALLDELRAAAGLGGRTRRLGDEAERARKAVTARIRDTLRRLDDRHPQLAEHLRATVSTGASCRYDPGSPAVTWRL
ncbi:ATP-binding protein [Amycolatopsis thermophila]|uniref:Tetratricopeptide (TPR) repeat protein n=1 Tax=Amycolatopsis thermophila TaxID=206084 RepID=A0ABU0F3J7_9PSEU|nr:AAA family ATPase [Amycolatopsis thermophila]MDQ0381607.1 tetratricopeptide (TPR) repeat protein [Amycolatopsis thermophila]